MKTRFQKTDHFHYRQWDRKIDDSVLDEILKRISRSVQDKTLLIVSNNLLKGLGCKSMSNENLIIVIKRNVLITLFKVNDLYQYLSSNKHIAKQIINE